MAVREILEGEGKLMGLISANVTLEGVNVFMRAIQPVLSALLMLAQLAIAYYTLRHLVKKAQAKKAEKDNVEKSE